MPLPTQGFRNLIDGEGIVENNLKLERASKLTRA